MLNNFHKNSTGIHMPVPYIPIMNGRCHYQLEQFGLTCLIYKNIFNDRKIKSPLCVLTGL